MRMLVQQDQNTDWMLSSANLWHIILLTQFPPEFLSMTRKHNTHGTGRVFPPDEEVEEE